MEVSGQSVSAGCLNFGDRAPNTLQPLNSYSEHCAVIWVYSKYFGAQ